MISYFFQTLCIVGFSTVLVTSGNPSTLAAQVKRISLDRRHMWLSPEEIGRLPMRGKAWEQVRRVALADWGKPDLSDQNSNHNTNVLAGALVAVRTNDQPLVAKVKANLRMISGTEKDGRTLALGRNLPAYLVAAGLVEFGDRDFDRWLHNVRHEELGGRTLISTHEKRPNNWGTHAGAARIAAAIYLEDQKDLERAAAVFAGWLGDRMKYAGFEYGTDLSWQANPTRPVGVNPLNARKTGNSIDGAIPDDMRRGGTFRWPPNETGYPWEALAGAVLQAELLHRQGYEAWNWSDQALRRAVAFLESVGWYAIGEDEEWLVHLMNTRYATRFRTPPVAKVGKNFGFADWTHPTESIFP